ncbi:SCO3242 family prenyltransferase [Nocardioides sp.]|uniref:SCO3242 family prenyltransferase n=1 Tax=Nocardioides sp. TaxID=35761 RepID=UPI0019873086|nr:UbiA family prenyltransferase [Nocardioides sp.]MBC7279560.1 UbiA family prenyltransferase [Nocardioides sp.]
MTSSARAFAELVRLPAALTVPGDTLAGAAAAGPLRARSFAMPAASVALYWAGMALNDWADRDLDAVERPERPIPSGRVSPRQALGVAAGLTAAGVGLAALVGGRPAAATAAALAGTVWAYDTVLKDTAAGPVAMAAARGLDVLLGASASGRTQAGLVPAGLLAAHTAGVTLLSRGEVHGARPLTAGIAGGVTVATAAAAAGHGRAALPVALAATYATSVGSAQLAAVSSPDAGTVRRATGAGIRGMIPLQAALVARRSPLAAVGLLVAGPIAKAASKVVSPT